LIGTGPRAVRRLLDIDMTDIEAKTSALLVVDMQNDFCPPVCPNMDSLIRVDGIVGCAEWS
jgi:hypothetical protein